MIDSKVLVAKLDDLKAEREQAKISDEDIEIVEKKVAEYKAKLMDELNVNVEQRRTLLNSQISLLEELLQQDNEGQINTSPEYL